MCVTEEDMRLTETSDMAKAPSQHTASEPHPLPESLHLATSASEVTAVVRLAKEGPLSWGMSPLGEEKGQKCEDLRTFLIKAIERSAEVQGGVELVEPDGLVRKAALWLPSNHSPLTKSPSRGPGDGHPENRGRGGVLRVCCPGVVLRPPPLRRWEGWLRVLL